ncbi:MAG: type II toxin-antitoxin system VapC family toxin [Pseudomonadota bacterium]|uniref:Type II toxin-antitoxin system VapC family toxin n=1 Tax=Candidatus Desulfatibia profunda TaxID=2841695 RepID=A0A8J6TLA7_9BACT|nr:type II toxin-antitoxin system VapC family toxin [Candidatus Desulfatibia profunda]MBL7178818.1 type II toxin-antitoxin system VapC family toxin [Desulfobacterales bacterium]
MKLVLDTNVYSDYAEGLAATVDFMAVHGRQLYLPAVVVGELNFGFMKGRQQQLNESKLQQFISRLKVELIDVNADVARKYAIIYLSLKKKGTKIPINDVWIAASCMEVGGTLLTRDRHFKVVEQIETVVLS